MADRYALRVARGYVQLVRRWEMDAREPTRKRGARYPRKPTYFDHGHESQHEVDACDECFENGWVYSPNPERGELGQRARSRNNMRRLFLSLPWEKLGPRPAMVTLTYPKEWINWVPTNEEWERQRRKFALKWQRKWGEPLVGVWAKEFQKSGRPHLHLYVGLPGALTDAEFEGLRKRTLMGKRLERDYGKFRGRSQVPPIGADFGGEFGDWLLRAWSESVGTWGKEPKHEKRGADVRVMFWTDEAEANADRDAIALYLAAEASKPYQKTPPGYFPVGRYYGTFGRQTGFVPSSTEVVIGDPVVARAIERRLVRWVKLRSVLRGNRRNPSRFHERREGDGVTAFGMGPKHVRRLLEYAERAVRADAGPEGRASWPNA